MPRMPAGKILRQQHGNCHVVIQSLGRVVVHKWQEMVAGLVHRDGDHAGQDDQRGKKHLGHGGNERRFVARRTSNWRPNGALHHQEVRCTSSRTTAQNPAPSPCRTSRRPSGCPLALPMCFQESDQVPAANCCGTWVVATGINFSFNAAPAADVLQRNANQAGVKPSTIMKKTGALRCKSPRSARPRKI